MKEALFVFAVMFCLDFVWARYVQACQDKRAIPAASLGAMLVLLNGVVTISYVADPWMLIPIVAGAFAGTWTGVKFPATPKKN